jgi:hypothetical protein
MWPNAVDYISFEATVIHISGDTLSIDQGASGQQQPPRVEVKRLARASVLGDLPSTSVTESPVLGGHTTICGGESISDEGAVSVGSRQKDTIAYEVRFTFTGRWMKQHWTFSPNRILLVTDGHTVVPQP